MWHQTKLENLFIEKIEENKSELLNFEKYKTNYETVKTYFCREVYLHINRKEPDLTDHGEVHIQNVLQNSFHLVKDDDLNGVELYILCMAILIHDIGNLNGRIGHEKILRKYFNKEIFKTIDSKDIQLISLIASKHGGKDCDAIGKLSLSTLDSQKVRSPKIASILRFADELAEGKQRTSPILLEDEGLLKPESIIYHQYAKILDAPVINKDTIILECNIHLEEIKVDLKILLNEVFRRIKKLNDERIYCSHYCKSIQDISKVTISLKIFKDDNFEEIKFTDSKLVNFEYSGQRIHCKDNFTKDEHVKKILEELGYNNDTK